MAQSVGQAGIELAEMERWRLALKKAIASGVLHVEDEGKRMTYKSTAEQLAALRMIENDIALAKGTTKRPIVVMTPRPY